MGYQMRFRLLLFSGVLIGAALLSGLWLQQNGVIDLRNVLSQSDGRAASNSNLTEPSRIGATQTQAAQAQVQTTQTQVPARLTASQTAPVPPSSASAAQTTPIQVVQTQAQAQEQPQEPGQIQPQARPVEVVVARPGTLTATRITSVIVEPAQESRIAAGTDGRVLNVLKRVDTRVAARMNL